MHLQNWGHLAMSHGRYLATPPVKIISPLTEKSKFGIIECFEFSCLCLQTFIIKKINRLDILSSFCIHIILQLQVCAWCTFLFAFFVVDFFLLIKRLLTILFTTIQILRDFYCHKKNPNLIETETSGITPLILRQGL